MKLLEDKKDKLGWAFVMCLVEKEFHRLLEGGDVQAPPVLRMVEPCDKLYDCWTESNWGP